MTRIADQFADIAARLAELESGHKCSKCKDSGWVYSMEHDEHLECDECENPEGWGPPEA